VTSEIVLAELLAPVSRVGAKPPNVRRRIYFGLLIHGRFFDLRPVTRGILIETADLRQVVNLKLPDAIHMVTAIQARCPFFLSNDRDTRRTPEGMMRVKPDRTGIEGIMNQIA
jgi:predicted nucleic acid-binding protein